MTWQLTWFWSHFIFHTLLILLNKPIQYKMIYWHHGISICQGLNSLFLDRYNHYMIIAILLSEISNPILDIMHALKVLNLNYTKLYQLVSILCFCKSLLTPISTSYAGFSWCPLLFTSQSQTPKSGYCLRSCTRCSCSSPSKCAGTSSKPCRGTSRERQKWGRSRSNTTGLARTARSLGSSPSSNKNDLMELCLKTLLS